MATTIVRTNEVELCVETFGDPQDPVILLIQGMAASMDWWEDEFCRRLAAGGRFVIRYDTRDTGQSVFYPPGRPGYTFRDLVEDAAGLVREYGPPGHTVGLSMGGMIAMQLALEHPELVASLTLMSTSPAGPGNAENGLPAPTAVRLSGERNPHSSVDYLQANLLEPPVEWSMAFDLVVEIYTVQALPRPLRPAASSRVSAFVAPGGVLLVIAAVDSGRDEEPELPPWPLTGADLELFGADAGLTAESIERIDSGRRQSRWRAVFRRAPSATD